MSDDGFELKQYAIPVSIDKRVVIGMDAVTALSKHMATEYLNAPSMPLWAWHRAKGRLVHRNPFPEFELFPGGQWLDELHPRFKRFRADWTERITTCRAVLRGDDIHADCDYY